MSSVLCVRVVVARVLTCAAFTLILKLALNIAYTVVSTFDLSESSFPSQIVAGASL